MLHNNILTELGGHCGEGKGKGKGKDIFKIYSIAWRQLWVRIELRWNATDD